MTIRTDYVLGDIVDPDDKNEENTELLKCIAKGMTLEKSLVSTGALNTTGTSFADIDATNLTKTVTCTADSIIVAILQGTFWNDTVGKYVYLDFSIGGARLGDSNWGLMYKLFGAAGQAVSNFNMIGIKQPGVGSKIIRPQWKVDGGTGRLSNGASPAADGLYSFYVLKFEPTV